MATQVEINEEILEELLESFRESQLRDYAAKALAGKSRDSLIKFIKKEFITKAKAMDFDEMVLLVAKTFFNYQSITT